MSELARELGGIAAFAGLPDGALDWLGEHMTEQRFGAGEILIRAGDPADRMFVVLEGEIRGVVENGQERSIFSVQAGSVTGMLPYSRLTKIPANIHAVAPVRAAWLPSSLFPEMLLKFPELGPRLVRLMADRIRENTRAGDQREKLAALGKLSAGLAHELNNPAAAARRATRSLREAVAAMRAADRELTGLTLSPDQRECLIKMATDPVDPASRTLLDPLERSDREQQMGDWLDDQGVEDGWTLAPNLVEAGFDLDKLERIRSTFPADAVGAVLRRASASLMIERLLDELESSTGRVTELVRAIKDYSFMDRGEEQDVDVHQGIENTLVMLRHRLKHGIKVIREYDTTLPHLRARGGELNQVWTNLIENAADAMNGNGELRIRTAREMNCVLVEVTDNGAGIPQEIQHRIFEPFFTTKGVGEGTGLGLDTVSRIVRTHHGNIQLESRPGETKFQIWLPLEEGAHA